MDINLLLLIAALVIGLIIGWIIARGQSGGVISELESRVRSAQTAAENAKQDLTNLQSELNVKQSHVNTLNANIGILEEKLRLAERGSADAAAAAARFQEELRVATTDRPAFEAELHQRDAELSQLNAELSQRDAELNELKAQLAKAQADTTELRAQIEALETEREIATLRAQFDADNAAQVQTTLIAAQPEADVVAAEAVAEESETEDAPDLAEVATMAAIWTTKAVKTQDEKVLAELQKEVYTLRDSIATLAFAGAELASAYEKRNKEYQDLLARVSREGISNVEKSIGPAGAMGLVAGGATMATLAAREEQAPQAEPADGAERLTATGPVSIEGDEARAQLEAQLAALKADFETLSARKVELETELQARTAQLEELKTQHEALRADLQTETSSKSELVTQLQTRDTDLGSLKQTLATLDAELDSVIGSRSNGADELITTPADGQAGESAASRPLNVIAKFALVKGIVDKLAANKTELESQLQTRDAELGDVKANLDNLSVTKADLEAKWQASDSELSSLKAQLAELQADVDAWLATPAEEAGEQVETDLKGKLALLKTNYDNLGASNTDLEAKLQTSTGELNSLKVQLDSLRSDLDALAGVDVDVDVVADQETAEPGEHDDLAGKLALVKTNFDHLNHAKAELEAQVQAKDADLASLNEQLTQLQSELQASAQAKAELEAQIQTKDADLASLNERLAQLQSELQASAQAKADLEAQVRSLGEQVGQLRVQVSQPDEGLSTLGKAAVAGAVTAGVSTITRRKGDTDDTEEATVGAEQAADASTMGLVAPGTEAAVAATTDASLELQAKDAEILDLTARLDATKNALHARNAEFDDLQIKFDNLVAANSKLATLQQELDEVNTRLASLSAEKTDLETSLNSRNAEFDALSAKMTSLRAELDETLAAKAQLEDSLKQRETEVNDLRSEIERVRAEGEQAVATRVAEIGVLTAGAAAAAATIKSRDEALEAAQQKIADLEAQINALNEAKAGAEGEITDLRVQLNALQDQLNAAIAERDALQSRMTEAAADVQTQLIAPAPEETASQVEATTEHSESAPTRAPESATAAKTLAMRAATEAGREVRTSACPQDLAETRGIGSVFEQRLYAAGIGTFWELANLTDDDFKRILELNERQLLRLDFNDIRADALRLAHETDSVGRIWEGAEPDDFEPLEGIGGVYERKLYEAGICTFEALASTPVERLMEICPPTKIRRPDYAAWIEQAKQIIERRGR